MLQAREQHFVNAFVVPRKRERYIELLRSPRRRRGFLRQLDHFRDFVPEFVSPLPKGRFSAEALLADLQRRGAGSTCDVISAQPALDGATMPLRDAIARVYHVAEATILSCVPGRLAYYEGEVLHNRSILSRHSTEL